MVVQPATIGALVVAVAQGVGIAVYHLLTVDAPHHRPDTKVA